MVQPKVFQLFHPIGGVGARFATATRAGTAAAELPPVVAAAAEAVVKLLIAMRRPGRKP
jgi:hypothetical protein